MDKDMFRLGCASFITVATMISAVVSALVGSPGGAMLFGIAAFIFALLIIVPSMER